MRTETSTPGGDMSRVPFITLSRSLRVPLALGAALAAVAVMGGSAYAEAPPAATPGPTDELGYVNILGATTAGEKLQWVDASEAARPDKADLPAISGADWLPASRN